MIGHYASPHWVTGTRTAKKHVQIMVSTLQDKDMYERDKSCVLKLKPRAAAHIQVGYKRDKA